MIGPDSNAKGGIATVIKNFQEKFTSPDFDFIYLVSWVEGYFFKRFIQFLICCWQVIIETRINKHSIVHIHVAQKGSFYRKSIFLLLVPHHCHVIFHMHASHFDIFYKKQSKLKKRYICWVFSKVDLVAALSKQWKAFYQTLGVHEICVIPNAVSIPTKYQYNSQSKKIVSFGRIGQRKGSFDILKVAKVIEKKFPEYQFVLYGDGEIEKIQKIIQKEHIKNVCIGGWITEKEQVLRETVIHLLPSYHEGLPMAILETMAFGIPNIASAVGGIPDVVKLDTGRLIEAGNISEIIQALEDLLIDQKKRERLSKQSCLTIKTKYSIEHYNCIWCQQYKKFFE